MSAADLFEDGFPHGTPAGYSEGCKSGACPGKEEFGMSCRMAWQAERSDRRYRRLADEGMPPAGIALELGMVEREQLSPTAAVALAAWRAGLQGVPAEAVKPATKPNPEPEPTPKAIVEPEPEPELVQLRAPRVEQTDTSRPARIRAWARERGYAVGETGPIRRAVLDAYTAWEAAGSPGPVSPPAESAADADVPEHTGHPGPADEFVAPPARPDYGQMMVDVDVERARRIAVHLEQLLAKAEEERDAALAEVHTITAALAREQQVAASAEAEAAALRRALADRRRARRGRGVGAWVRRMVAR